jgi:TRAP-type C4-dicarboxylate transport system permease small subunit
MNGSFLDNLRRAGRVFNSVEKWMLIGLVAFLAGFALLQIILRNFFSTGIVWGDTLLRHVMLWVSFLGAMRATAEGRHIRIEILPMVLPARGKYFFGLICNFVPSIVCIVLTVASLNFLEYERQASNLAFSNVPTWWLETIFPVSFAVMAIRFAIHFIEDLARGPKEREA